MTGVKTFVASTVAALAVLAVGTGMIAKYTPLLSRLRPATGYMVGNHVDLPAEMYDKTNGTLVIFGRIDCSACKNSLPFLEQLVADLKPYRSTSQAIAITLADGSPDLGIKVDATYQLSANKMIVLDLEAVPTLIWVDRKGKILFSRSGILNKDNSPAVIRDILALAEQAKTTQ